MKHPICYLSDSQKQHHKIELKVAGENLLKCSVTGNGTVSLIGTYEEKSTLSDLLLSDFAPASDLDLDSSSENDSSEEQAETESQDSGE